MLSNWDKVFDYLIIEEGGYSDDPRDPGNKMRDGRPGSTKWGVTQQNWQDFVGHTITQQDMMALEKETVKPFYKAMYWDMCHCSDMPSGLDYAVFDFAVNSGISRAIKELQTVCGIVADGKIGPVTMQAVQSKEMKDLLTTYCNAREDYLKDLNNPTYERGWVLRVDRVLARCVEMIHAA